jgi:uncharacterized protein
VLSLDPYFWLASLAAFLVGLSKGGLPSIGMLAVPLLALVTSPVQAAALLLPLFVISDWVALWLYRRDFSAANLRILLPAGLAGVGLGWATSSMVSDRAITFLIGFMGLAFCLDTWLRRPTVAAPRPPSVAKGWFWGGLSGFTSFISHSGAPPFQIYLMPQKLDKAQFVGTSTLFFAVVNAAKILPYHQLRPYSTEGLWNAAALVPAALVGTVVGAYLTRRLADRWFYRLVQAGLFLVSMKLLADAIGVGASRG